MNLHSLASFNQDLIKSKPEEIVTKEVGVEADAMSAISIVLIYSSLEPVTSYKGNGAQGGLNTTD